MNCKEAVELIAMRADGECDTAAEAELKQHLRACDDCGVHAEMSDRLDETINYAPTPRITTTKLEATKLLAAAAAREMRPPRRTLALYALAAAAAVLLFLTALFGLSDGEQDQGTPDLAETHPAIPKPPEVIDRSPPEVREEEEQRLVEVTPPLNRDRLIRELSRLGVQISLVEEPVAKAVVYCKMAEEVLLGMRGPAPGLAEVLGRGYCRIMSSGLLPNLVAEATDKSPGPRDYLLKELTRQVAVLADLRVRAEDPYRAIVSQALMDAQRCKEQAEARFGESTACVFRRRPAIGGMQ